jgi:hypothetical protein
MWHREALSLSLSLSLSAAVMLCLRRARRAQHVWGGGGMRGPAMRRVGPDPDPGPGPVLVCLGLGRSRDGMLGANMTDRISDGGRAV